MNNLISLILIAAISVPDALAEGKHRRPGAPAAAPGTVGVAEPVAAAAKLEEACKVDDPFVAPAPKPSDAPDAVTVDDENVDEAKWPSLKFKAHCEVDGQPMAGCDVSLAASLKYVREGKLALKNLKDVICKGKVDEAKNCANQAEALKCVQSLYNSVATEFGKISESLKAKAAKLKEQNARVQQQALRFTMKAPTEITAPLALTKAREIINNEGLTGENKKRGPNQTEECAKEVMSSSLNRPAPSIGVRKVCSQITAASDTAFYAKQLEDAAAKTKLRATEFKANADGLKPAIDNSGSVNQPPPGPAAADKKGGVLDSVGGLDGLMKMATLGIMGAGLYCSVSGECAAKPSTTNPAATATGPGATAPTPASTNPGVETSNTGDPTKVVNNHPTAGSTELPKVEPPHTPDNFSSGASGFSMDKDNERALAPFSGALDRAPSSSGSVGGGGASAGAEGGSAPAEAAAETPKTSSADAGGLGAGGGGGGLSHSGGFSLSDPTSASPADSALKNILNGEPPPDAGLASVLDGGGQTGGASQAGDIDVQGAESLFLRVRDTHVRCIRRGCVGHEVGENI